MEGTHSLMLFRKSASAKMKKVFKDKLDANQTVDYKDMNVHIAALLLKVSFLFFSNNNIIFESLFKKIYVLKRST
jgi:hypothetical protein